MGVSLRGVRGMHVDPPALNQMRGGVYTGGGVCDKGLAGSDKSSKTMGPAGGAGR